jgi:hypothetical protein
MGARICAGLTTTAKSIDSDVPVYVMIAAPLTNESIDELFDAGVDELGMNLEFWADSSWEKYIPGKARVIGKSRYLDALEYAGQKFGPIRARSILICGLEAASDTERGVRELTGRNVMPILSPFRPLDGTLLAAERGFDVKTYEELFVDCSAVASSYGLPLGPTCNACQNNVLAVPKSSLLEN